MVETVSKQINETVINAKKKIKAGQAYLHMSKWLNPQCEYVQFTLFQLWLNKLEVGGKFRRKTMVADMKRSNISDIMAMTLPLKQQYVSRVCVK